MSTPIANRTILVTGANRGIGRALVEEALHRGANRVYAGTRQPFEHPDDRVTRLALDVTDAAQIQTASESIEALDVVINNAGLAIYDELGDRAVLEQHLAVNLFGPFDVTHAFLPLLTRSQGAVVNVLSLASLAALPIIASYSLSKAAAYSLTQSQRALLAGQGVRVHAVLLGPVDTEMSRDLEIPKAAPADVARAVFDGLQSGEEDIFPDPMSASLAPEWDSGAIKTLERANAALISGTHENLTITFTVDRTPDEVFAAINDVRSWWTGEIDGVTDQLGAQFTYRYENLHRSTQEITELVPGKRVAWHVVDAHLSFVADKEEWTGTDITFDLTPNSAGTEVRFTHVGLVPTYECFDNCSTAWNHYIGDSLRNLMADRAA
ncbi:short-subunit dehydrogenase [Kribbella sp. VKM Ac-2527]|uniref:Short-subunit dehydrogenase n=1 Tax=Kribbella caucasensis TaxID=2512215 RepID=A0A4R6KI68_9ACTN|nr:SDR family NAD(P)-dependent oxidoreductase [Kribbella sp. VKM Ac-2527]TDO50780.1 short-subunit dehydrogenase [Kribbella sp. VKM Ac-2527]